MAVVVPRVLISEHHSLCETYTNLLIRAREIDNIDNGVQSECVHCQKHKLQHFTNGRCHEEGVSQVFSSIHRKERERIEKCLKLIEELRAV